MITCAPAPVDRFPPAIGCNAGLGTRKSAAAGDMAPPIDRAPLTGEPNGATIDCCAATITRGTATVDGVGGNGDANFLLGSRMRGAITGRGRVVDGSAPPSDRSAEMIDRHDAHACLNAVMITRSPATIDHNPAMITH